MRVIVLSCLGLGDGLISLVLANNLYKNGHEVVTVHLCLESLQAWFPHLRILPLSSLALEDLALYDRIFLFHEKTPRMLEIEAFCLKNHSEKSVVLNPIATSKKDYLFWENGKFDGSKTFVDNLANYCSKELKLKQVTKNNGIKLIEGVHLHKYPKRIIIHPTSSQESKNWSWEKFKVLSEILEEEGWDPQFLLTKEEKARYPSCRGPELDNLPEMAAFIAESGGMIGNDSGVGHLASCLNLPTVTICRKKEVSLFWRPGWAEGIVITPPAWLPNLKWMRWRDRHWKNFISVEKVMKAFRKLSFFAYCN